MKKVVSIDMVAHLWANQSQSEARNPQGNFFFNDDKIYSYGYHFVIAKHVTNDKGEKAVLYSDRTYSHTTSKHQWIVKAAIHGQKMIIVPDAANTREANFNTWFSRIAGISKSLANARKPEKYLTHIQVEYNNAVKYAEFLGIEVPIGLKNLYNSVFTPEYKQSLQAEYQQKQAEKRAWELKQKEQDAETLAKWHNGEGYRLYLTGIFNQYSYLRLAANGNEIQTSQNVMVPLDVAKRFYATILETIKNGGCIDCNIKFMHTYNVREITADHIIVGCHKITIAEIQRLTSSLNW